VIFSKERRGACVSAGRIVQRLAAFGRDQLLIQLMAWRKSIEDLEDGAGRPRTSAPEHRCEGYEQTRDGAIAAVV
jgi:hypothetical protein